MYKNEYIQWDRDGITTWVRKDLRCKESEYSACEGCEEYKPSDRENNCGHAVEIKELYEAWGIVAVVFECPYRVTERQEGWTCQNCGAVNSDVDAFNTRCSYCAEPKENL